MHFEHLDKTWAATPTGMGHGVGSGSLPPVNRWGVVFKAVGESAEYRGSISASRPEDVSTTELKAALDEQLVLAAIERSQYTWRPAEAISRDTHIPLEEVRKILEGTTVDIIVRPELNRQGLTLYSTREHYQRTTNVVRRYFDTLESS